MTTLRSEYSFEQFEEVLQNLAHKIALDAVKNLNKGDVRIVIHGPRFSRVETGRHSFNFYAKHASYHEYDEDGVAFDVEEKLYMTSHHRTKISYEVYPKEKEKEMAEKITKFVDEIMAESGIKPVPRFSLDNHTRRHKR